MEIYKEPDTHFGGTTNDKEKYIHDRRKLTFELKKENIRPGSGGARL